MIPFVDLKAQYRSIKLEIDAAIARVFETGQFVLGDEVAAFEKEFAAACGAAHGVAMSSGTAALQLALVAAGVGAGDEVITVPLTFVATAASILYTGARPVFVDVDPRSFTMDPALVEAAITPRTKAIMPVHLYGQPADMDPIRDIAARRGLLVIEDAAQAHAARYKGLPAGSLGDLACFSFYPSKNLGAYGEGGLVTTNRADFAEQLRLLRNWGERTKYQHVVAAFNARMQGLQGAILRVKLRHLEDWTESRRRRATRYNALLKDSGLGLPEEMPYARHVYHLYTVRVRERAAVRASLEAAGIQTGLHYPLPVHLQPAYANLGYRADQFPVAERAAAEVLSLPMYPELTDDQIVAVADAVRQATSHQPPATSLGTR
ncbi:MAG: DegT/DnrJ/EryC1/StrS family aminotransferase [Acidobacteria bacterium]|nr:DegT/DnrJ/EryC1/StrS family aminotransferase [Acidobacteriota bacterium]